MPCDFFSHNPNAFEILGITTRIMKENGASKELMAQYMEHAKSGNYEHLKKVSNNTLLNLGDLLADVADEADAEGN
ncbi:MAG: hypothetical protein OXC46_03080 [Thaumarchaeota archaeon]|nr:hypothetical protein [Nitrososphaerota archaeon]